MHLLSIKCINYSINKITDFFFIILTGGICVCWRQSFSIWLKLVIIEWTQVNCYPLTRKGEVDHYLVVFLGTLFSCLFLNKNNLFHNCIFYLFYLLLFFFIYPFF